MMWVSRRDRLLGVMKVSERLFGFVNPVIVAMLRSPLHPLMSSSILVIEFTGIKSGTRRTVPVRYMQTGNQVCCTTSLNTGWWYNFKAPQAVELTLAGKRIAGIATAISHNPNMLSPILRELWSRHPADAAYMNVKLDKTGQPDPHDFDRASEEAVLINIELQS